MDRPSEESARVTTRLATAADAAAVAALHLETLPDSVSDLTPLGAGVVRRFYAAAIERGLASVAVAIDDAGAILGFVMVTPDVAALFPRALLAGPGDWLRFLAAVRPTGLVRAVITKLGSGTARVAAVPELVYLGVSTTARGRGVGAALMDAAHAALRRQGIRGYELHVHADNAAAVKLYLEHGLQVARRFTKGGRELLNMRKELG
jgi:ribosomal protein S18 acetylase RimI-like enzyme